MCTRASTSLTNTFVSNVASNWIRLYKCVQSILGIGEIKKMFSACFLFISVDGSFTAEQMRMLSASPHQRKISNEFYFVSCFELRERAETLSINWHLSVLSAGPMLFWYICHDDLCQTLHSRRYVWPRERNLQEPEHVFVFKHTKLIPDKCICPLRTLCRARL